MKKMMVLPAKFASFPGCNRPRNVEIGYNTIYAVNISVQNVMTRKIFLQMMIFFVIFASDHKYLGQIFIRLSIRVLNYAMKLSALTESLPIQACTDCTPDDNALSTHGFAKI